MARTVARHSPHKHVAETVRTMSAVMDTSNGLFRYCFQKQMRRAGLAETSWVGPSAPLTRFMIPMIVLQKVLLRPVSRPV